MKTLSRLEVRKAFNEIVAKYGKPKGGDVYCEDQLISEVVRVLSTYAEANITFEYGRFEVSPNVWITAKYAEDHTFIGTVKTEEWFSKEQIRALHELSFGYQF